MNTEQSITFAYRSEDAFTILGHWNRTDQAATDLYVTRDRETAKRWQAELRAGRLPKIERPPAIYSPDQPFTP